MSYTSHLSTGMYVCLFRYIGTPTEITMRREVLDTKELLKYKVSVTYISLTGSFSEGFRFKSSDKDFMIWDLRNKVITDLSQYRISDLFKHSILLVEDIDTPPGFVRLELISSKSELLNLSAIRRKDIRYISSSMYKNNLCISMPRSLKTISVHGPCLQDSFEYEETDLAFCFHCIHWPRMTKNWVQRCIRHNWPPKTVLAEILKNGCHFVPIGSKTTSGENPLEWRLSFSKAEKTLVYSMNHTQFLCYGLLKIFLTEIVNYGKTESLLCSYFIKTTTFWLIQVGHITWYPNNLLYCFWKCFEFLLNCVRRGVFPNFFIPQNNMFVNKVVGFAQQSLTEQLMGYYECGMSCLLQSQTLKVIIEKLTTINVFRILPIMGDIKSVVDMDISIKKEVFRLSLRPRNLQRCFIFLESIVCRSQLSLSEYQKVVLQYCTADVLVRTAFIYLNASSDCSNQKNYKLDRYCSNMLKQAGTVCDESNLLFLAMYFYRTCRYQKALHIAVMTKSKLMQRNMMCFKVHLERYHESVVGLSLSKRMKRYWSDNIRIYCDLLYIQELALEQEASYYNNFDCLYISPYVMPDMLRVFCNHRLGNRSQCLQSLTDLQTLLLYDDGTYIDLYSRDMSWQILGICQHVVGDLRGALRSYIQSLRQTPIHGIQKASVIRIRHILSQLQV